MSERDELAEVISAHAYDTGWRCSCGWTGTASEYDAHLADALLASPQFAHLEAEAWDEGLAVGMDDDRCTNEENPYRPECGLAFGDGYTCVLPRGHA